MEPQAEADRLVIALAVLHCQVRQIERRLYEVQREGDVRLSTVDLEGQGASDVPNCAD